MSITHQMFRNILQQRHCCGKLHNAFFQHKSGIRSIHIDVVKLGNVGQRSIFTSSGGILLADTGLIPGCTKTLRRSTPAFFIISRNESTGSSSSLLKSESDLTIQSIVTEGSSAATSFDHTSTLTSTDIRSSTDQTVTLNPADNVASLGSTSQEELIFESIPEPPPVPIVDEVTGAILGEPTFQSIGLGGWSPSGIVQQCLEYFHVTLGMPWWAAILTGTIIVRLMLFPLVVKSQKNAARLQNNMPQLQVLQAKMTEARQTGNALLSAKYGQDIAIFMKEKDISPFKTMLVPFAMAPVFISFFFGLRKMANLPVESLKEGGLFWFTDLTLVDPFYLLPLITSVTVFITLEVGVDGAKMSSGTHAPLMKYFLRAIPVIMFPFIMNFPAAILCYWVSTNAISLVQVSLLKIPAVRDKLKIERLRTITPDMLTVKKKGFRESFKESWTNIKISREIEDRTRYDEINFKRAGRGPIPKTFKYDPTKVDPLKDAAAAMQAKRK